ncbi:MAG: 2-deoxy-D-gluconate 3-dehydrogenase [Rhodospirillales bacterium 69-11]|nr:MAG: 2-deoxy-D-gluconate 3-dehydrogenase [Rhodospirillales bacterium 69-11]
MNLFDLTGKVAIVTGGNGGIGLGMAEGIASCGASIVIAGRNAEKAQSALQALGKLGVQARFIRADVTRKADCQALVSQTAEAFGRVDILVNNAGTSIRKMPQEFTEEEWHHVLDTNLTSAFLCSQAAYPAMKQAGGGKMINIGSMMSLFGAPFATPYAASKGGIVQMTRALATAWAGDNIQVNAVLPGWIDTELTQRAREQVNELHTHVERRTPVGRWGVPRDMSGVAAFLASSASDFVTGTAIPVDGGFSTAI